MSNHRKSSVKNKTGFDPLTGVVNQKYFEIQLDKELQRAARYGHPLSILLIDIDDFQKVNDEFGRQEGDRVLQELCYILGQSLRAVDIIARHGEDEFILLLPETKKALAKRTAERVLKNVKKYDFFKDNLRVKDLNVSIGIAGFPEDAGRTDEMVKKANSALHKAKQQGGNKVILCD
jgi:diguanylate cyclase (GGDEF)-like protein